MQPEALAETLEEVRRELRCLGERVAALEAAAGPKPAAAPVASVHTAARQAEAAGVSEEILLVISAAVAAFLGKGPHIRQVRLVGSRAWAQQGRVTVQASHALSVKHG
jgi:methylmalonyl-CoA carboxyltransferase large subunit